MKVCFFILFCSAYILFAQKQPSVPEFLVSGDDNNPSTLKQTLPVLTKLNSDNFLVTWQDMRDGFSYYAQKFDKNGNKVGTNFKVAVQHAFLGPDNNLLTLWRHYFLWRDDTLYTIYANLFNAELNLIKEFIYIGGGAIYFLDTAYIFGKDLVAGNNENFYILSNNGGWLGLNKLNDDGTVKYYYTHKGFPFVTSIALTVSQGSTLAYAWLKGAVDTNGFNGNKDTLAAGIYFSIINPDDSTGIPAQLVTTFYDDNDPETYISDYELKVTDLSDSLFKLFWVNKYSTKMYSIIFNNRGEMLLGIDSLTLPDELTNPSLISFALSNKDEEGFYAFLSYKHDNDIEDGKEYLIRYNLQGEATGEIYSRDKDLARIDSNFFNSGSGILFTAESDGDDIFLVKNNHLDSLSSILVNDEESGSKEKNYSIKAYGNEGVFALWDDEKNHYGASIYANGSVEKEISLDHNAIVFFPDKKILATWKKKDNETSSNVGYTIYDKDFNEVFSKTLAVSSNLKEPNITTEIISDSIFIVVLTKDSLVSLYSEGISGSTINEIQNSLPHTTGTLKIFKDEDFIWIQSDMNFEKYSYSLSKLDDFSLSTYNYVSYIGNDRFLISSSNSGYNLIGHIIKPDLDTLKSFNFELYGDAPSYFVERLTNNRFIFIRKEWGVYRAAVFNNNGTLISQFFRINSSDNKADFLHVLQNGEEVYFTWSEARTPGKSFDIYCVIYDIDEITDVNIPFAKNYLTYKLEQNYPNPFNPVTNISYSVATSSGSGMATIKIYDVLGNEVATLVNEEKDPGVYNITFDGSNLASGVYFYQLKVSNYIETKKMLLLK